VCCRPYIGSRASRQHGGGCGTPAASRRARITRLVRHPTSDVSLRCSESPSAMRDLRRREHGTNRSRRRGTPSTPAARAPRDNGVDVSEVDVDAHVRDRKPDQRHDRRPTRPRGDPSCAHTGSQATARRSPRGREVSARSDRTLLLRTRFDRCRSGAFQGGPAREQSVCFLR